MIHRPGPSGGVAFQVEGKEGGEERLAGQVGGPAVGGENGEAPPSPVATGRHRERQEVAVEGLGRRAEFVVAHQEVADDLARRAISFSRPCQRLSARVRSKSSRARSRAPANRSRCPVTWPAGAADLAADVAQLLHQRELEPASGGESRVQRLAHHCTSSSTISAIRRRVAGSSTDRDRCPCRGRTLIIESNSIQPVSPCWSG